MLDFSSLQIRFDFCVSHDVSMTSLTQLVVLLQHPLTSIQLTSTCLWSSFNFLIQIRDNLKPRSMILFTPIKSGRSLSTDTIRRLFFWIMWWTMSESAWNKDFITYLTRQPCIFLYALKPANFLFNITKNAGDICNIIFLSNVLYLKRTLSFLFWSSSAVLPASTAVSISPVTQSHQLFLYDALSLVVWSIFSSDAECYHHKWDLLWNQCSLNKSNIGKL